MLPPAKDSKRPRVTLAEYEMWEKGGLDALTILEEEVVKTCREMRNRSITVAEFQLLISVCKKATQDRSNAFEQAVTPSPEVNRG